MNGHWSLKRLKEFPVEFIDGDRSSRYPKRSEFVGSGVLFLNAESISGGSFNIEAANFISEEKFASIKKGRLRSQDIVLTMRGNGVGKVGFFFGGPDRGLINAQMLIVRPDPELIEPRFLYYLLRSPYYFSCLRSLAPGSAQPQLSITSLRELEVSIPPLIQQKHISSILSSYDDLIENNLRRIKILEEMAQNLYREWFVKFRFPGHEQVRMVDSPREKIPEGWEPTVLGDFAVQVRRGVSPDNVDAATPYVGLEHIPRKSIALAEWGTVGQVESTKLRFEENEILFGKIRPYFHKVAVAPLDGVCSSDTIVIKPKSSDAWSLVLGCVSSEEFVAHATQTSQGTKMPRAN